MEGIGFENMKVFKKRQWFDFKNITLLTGTNNSGKSSIINAMQMLQDNIKARNIDQLLKTEFKLTSNQNKYGSISNFVNNEAKPEENSFVFIRQNKNIEYRIKIDINSGLENYGNVNMIKAVDVFTNEIIFLLLVEKPYPEYECMFHINYKYFIDRFNKKCANTKILRKRIIELDKFKCEVNNGEKTEKEFKQFADKVSQEVSVYISYGEAIRIDDLDVVSNIFSYSIEHFNFDQENQKIDEIGVFFTETKNEDSPKFKGFISEEDYAKLYEPTFKNGIFDFSLLWKNNPEIETEFKDLICSYYNKNYQKSFKLLCDDLITLLSNNYWRMKETYSNIDPFIAPENLTKTFIDSLPDFGLISSMFIRKEENYVANNYVKANHQVNEKAESIMQLRNSDFFEEVYNKLPQLFLDYFNANGKKINHEELITEPVFNQIYSDIIDKTFNLNLSLNNVYVSSNRFITKRAYHFNDNTDFTNLLKQVESSMADDKKICKEFINKWIKEFGIADELLLKPDIETGNFKAFLRTGDKETQLADFGLGTNQLLPIIFSLGIHSYYPTQTDNLIKPRTVVIEEPEANLHPAMQSKLADMFVEANNKFDVQIIAETHSEYIVRRFQNLVAKKYLGLGVDEFSIANDKVNIYYINSDIDELGRKAFEINFTKNGQLTESFGKGFYDETTNLQFELYKLNNAQSN